MAQEASKAPEPPKKFDMDSLLEQWFKDHFHNCPISWDTQIFNHVRAAANDLSKRLKGAI